MNPKIERMAYIAKCRSFQKGMKAMNYVVGYRTPTYFEGSGCIKEVGRIIREHGYHSVFIVTDKTIVKIGLLQGVLDSLHQAALPYEIFDEVEPNPTSLNVENGYARYAKHLKQPIIAIGGGSAMDCAKAISAKSVHPRKRIVDMQGVLKVHKKTSLFIAIPTTAGTGSETTLASVITDSKTRRKAAINDPCLIPDYAILDPDLTLGLPPKITATTGLDALCHAVESYTNSTYNTDLENFLAKEAVRLIHDNLMKAYHNGSDIVARGNMQKAAFFAGRSFTRGCVGYVHAVGHTLGGLYGTPHGLAMSIILPHVLRQYGDAVTDKLSELADACNIPGTTKKEKANRFIEWIEHVKQETEIPVGVDWIKEEDIPQMITWAMLEANPLYPTPVTWLYEDFYKLIETLRTN